MSSLLIVFSVALIIPLLMAKFNIVNIPTSVAEIIIGILLGKSCFNIVHPDSPLNQLSTLGVIILIFLSGLEIDFSVFKINTKKTIKNSPIIMATEAIITIILLSALYSFILYKIKFLPNIILGVIIFSTISLGIVIAALKEKEVLSESFGQTILLIAALGEIIPLLMLTAYSTIMGGNIKKLWPILLIFIAAILLLLNFKSFFHFFNKINKSTTQLDIRLAFFLVIMLVSIAEHVGAENILGAFLAGIVMNLLRPKEETLDKLNSLGYGFFIPIFFIMTGVKLNLKVLNNLRTLAFIPIIFLGFIFTKFLILFILKTTFNWKQSFSGMILSTTTITLVIPTLTVAKSLKLIGVEQSGVFILSAIITCIMSPILFNKFYTKEKENIPKTTIHFLGINNITVSLIKQLSQNSIYNIRLFTDNKDNYKKYHYNKNISILKNLDIPELEKNNVFKTDILVLGFINENINYKLAKIAIKKKVPRIIAKLESQNLTNNEYNTLKNNKVEIYNTYEANINLLKRLIETPATLNILNDTIDGLFEIVVKNRKLAGKEVKSLPLINKITIIEIYHDKKLILPHGDTQIHWGDHIVFISPKNIISKMRQIYEKIN